MLDNSCMKSMQFFLMGRPFLVLILQMNAFPPLHFTAQTRNTQAALPASYRFFANRFDYRVDQDTLW